MAPDIEELVIAYLASVGLTEVAFEMPNEPVYPFHLVNRISGGDDDVTDCPAVSIHVFHTSRALASEAARIMHHKMKQLTAKIPIQVEGGYVSVDRVYVIETPHWEDYGDKQIERYCGRYRIETRVNLTT